MVEEKVADLVLEGGGVKGIGLVGACSVLQEQGYRFNRIAGTSAGAIVGALLAADMPLDELQRVMRELDYNKFQDESFLDRLGPPGRAISLIFEKGIYEGKYLKSWLDGLLTDLGKRRFGDLRIDDPHSSLPPYRLVVMASDVSRGELTRFPWDYKRKYGLDPDEQLVADAVRASMSIPFFYEPITLDYEDGKTKSYLVDGGMLSNFPIEVFDAPLGRRPRWPTFGIKLSARRAAVRQHRFKVESTLDLVKAMVATMTGFHDQMHIDEECVLRRLIFVDSLDVKATDFDLDAMTQQQLFQNGRTGAANFLAGWDFEKYIAECRQSPDLHSEEAGRRRVS